MKLFQHSQLGQNSDLAPTLRDASAPTHLPKRHTRTLVLTITLSLLLFFGNSIQLLEAQGGATGTNTFPHPFMQDTLTPVNNLCEPAMKEFSAQQLQEYRDFLETHFQNKSSSSSLLGTAIEKYRALRSVLMNAYSKYYPNQGSSFLLNGLQPNACLKIVNETLGDAKILLEKHVVRTSGVKKSTAMIEKYRSINTQLQSLNLQFANMKAYFDAFSQKLPCYVSTGTCTKGL